MQTPPHISTMQYLRHVHRHTRHRHITLHHPTLANPTIHGNQDISGHGNKNKKQKQHNQPETCDCAKTQSNAHNTNTRDTTKPTKNERSQPRTTPCLSKGLDASIRNVHHACASHTTTQTRLINHYFYHPPTKGGPAHQNSHTNAPTHPTPSRSPSSCYTQARTDSKTHTLSGTPPPCNNKTPTDSATNKPETPHSEQCRRGRKRKQLTESSKNSTANQVTHRGTPSAADQVPHQRPPARADPHQ